MLSQWLGGYRFPAWQRDWSSFMRNAGVVAKITRINHATGTAVGVLPISVRAQEPAVQAYVEAGGIEVTLKIHGLGGMSLLSVAPETCFVQATPTA
jgi:hypothetical protein